MSARPIAYFVRHGETSGNAANTFRGKIDFPLTDVGKQQAKEVGKFFKSLAISAVYASPKKRTMDTAEAIALPKQLKIQTVEAFKPIDVGFLSGQPKDEHTDVMDYFDKNPHEKIPMGESINEFRARTQPPLKKLLVEGAQAKDPVVGVVHSSIIHEVNHIVSGDHNQTLVKPGGIIGVFKHPTKGLEIKALLHPEKEEQVPYHG